VLIAGLSVTRLGRLPCRRSSDAWRTRRTGNEGGRTAAREPREQRRPALPDYYLIPILLVIMSLGLVALIYWGGFVEERRNGRT
jgi:hypothetical protein